MTPKLTRRTFTKTGSAAAIGFSTLGKPFMAHAGPNDKIHVGFIGVGNRGSQLLDAFLAQEDVVVPAVCDVYEPYIDRARKRIGAEVAGYKDFRKMLERRDLDAVVIATPDHWHAIQTIDACRSGKDVYVEKPLSITIREGRRMVEVAREEKRVVQVGTHRRSSRLYQRLAQVVSEGTMGKITVGRCYRLSNMYPNGIGKEPVSDPPPELDWDLWLGPRPERPYQANIAPYKFRWWRLYSSQSANWGVHYLDAIRWMTGDEAPVSVCAMGGRFAVDDDRTIPDTLEAVFELPSGALAVFGQYEASGHPALRMGEVELRGTLGTVFVSTRSFQVIPEKGGQFQDPKPRMEPMKEEDADKTNAQLTQRHARNFLDCIRTRNRPNADIEIGHRSTTFSLLANISLAVGARLDWNAEKEVVTNCDEANKLLQYEYRFPWKLG